jgi:hypothetical protein
MARVLAVVPDLLFGSRVKGVLEAGGHEVTLAAAAPGPETLAGVDALVVDLAGPPVDAGGLVGQGPPALAVYSHVEGETRERALAEGYALAVPRSRLVREGAALVERLLSA